LKGLLIHPDATGRLQRVSVSADLSKRLCQNWQAETTCFSAKFPQFYPHKPEIPSKHGQTLYGINTMNKQLSLQVMAQKTLITEIIILIYNQRRYNCYILVGLVM
jgi:hypothetical protein